MLKSNAVAYIVKSVSKAQEEMMKTKRPPQGHSASAMIVSEAAVNGSKRVLIEVVSWSVWVGFLVEKGDIHTVNLKYPKHAYRAPVEWEFAETTVVLIEEKDYIMKIGMELSNFASSLASFLR